MAPTPAIGHGAHITLREDAVNVALAERDCFEAVERIAERIRSIELLKPEFDTHLERVQEQGRRLALHHG